LRLKAQAWGAHVIENPMAYDEVTWKENHVMESLKDGVLNVESDSMSMNSLKRDFI
jgi:hypothetical protein